MKKTDCPLIKTVTIPVTDAFLNRWKAAKMSQKVKGEKKLNDLARERLEQLLSELESSPASSGDDSLL